MSQPVAEILQQQWKRNKEIEEKKSEVIILQFTSHISPDRAVGGTRK